MAITRGVVEYALQSEAPMKKPTSYRLSREGLRLAAALAKKLGIPKTAVIEIALREMAERKGV